MYRATSSLCKLRALSEEDKFSLWFSTKAEAMHRILFVHEAYDGDNIWSYLTLTLMLVPALIMTSFSLVWYFLDQKVRVDPPRTCRAWTLRLFFHGLQLAPLVRLADAVYYGIASRQADVSLAMAVHYTQLMLYEDADSAMLRMIECFMEAAPQLLLQLYIIFTQEKHKQTFQIMWLIARGTTFCSPEPHTLTEFLFDTVLGAVYCFDVVNVREGHSRLSYLIWYSLIGLENASMTWVWSWLSLSATSRSATTPIVPQWLLRSSKLSPWIHALPDWVLPICVALSFLAGIAFMIVYYLYGHPSRNIQVSLHNAYCKLEYMRVYG
ncbi:unnamed protein product [Echinostoma caproni]|uniref:XK-related protein n=1 Tax=Echinostoma caproni TaxID=27848 RepID=A0A183AUQ4_9TREM|nr:unnamed protein product [Echinostoma caproni]